MYAEGTTVPLLKTTNIWAGASGLFGYTNLFFETASTPTPTEILAIADAAHDFFEDIAAQLPTTVTVTTQPVLEQINEATGILETVWAVSPAPAAVGGGMTGQGPSPAGACVSWQTGEVHGGRQVRGRTFLVPLGAAAFQSDGTLSPTSVSLFNTAAVNLIGAPDATFSIWSRPRTGLAGAAFPAVTGTCRDQVAVLRSRRD